MNWRTNCFTALTVLGMASFFACDDLTLPTLPDGGSASTSSSGGSTAQGALPTFAPQGAILGQTVSAFTTTLSNWATVDATGVVKEFSYSLPLAAVTALEGQTADVRVYLTVPQVMLDQTAVTGLAIDYIPHGHVPVGIYDTPHWEWHMIVESPLEDFKNTDCSDPTLPADAFLPPYYIMVPQSCLTYMGFHSVDLRLPEFNKQKFTKSNLLVYYHGKLASFEPKATLEYLKTRQSFTLDAPITPPGSLKRDKPTLMPTKLVGNYLPDADTFVMTYSNWVQAT